MKKDYRLGFKYGLNPLSNALFWGLGYSIFAVLFLYNKPTVLIISIFCVGFTLFILMKLYNKHLSQRYRFKIGIIINTVYTCNIEYIYTNMFSIDDDGTVFIFLKKRDKRNPITTVYRKDDDDEPDCITRVYAMEKESSGYQLVWTGEIKNESSEFILLEPGKYSVKIAVENRTYSPFVSTEYSATGYNVYAQLNADGFVNAIYDGKGIYFE